MPKSGRPRGSRSTTSRLRHLAARHETFLAKYEEMVLAGDDAGATKLSKHMAIRQKAASELRRTLLAIPVRRR